MLTIQQIKDNKENVIISLRKKNFKNFELIDDVIILDNNRKQIQLNLDTLLSEKNKLSKIIGELYSQKKIDEANKLKIKSNKNKDVIEKYKKDLEDIEVEIKNILYQIPNTPHLSVPDGLSSEDNEIIFSNEINVFLQDHALSHWDLCQKYNLISFELGVKITGSGFPVYIGKGAKLQRALIQYFLDKNTENGYLEINPPLMVNEASAYATGQLPDKESQMYYISEDNLYLIPTSEVPVTNIYRNDVLNSKDLPIKNTAYSACFRREAGSYGKDVRGLNRLHQFEKVEIVRIEKPENSYQALEEMVQHVKLLLEDLKLPYRILRLCGGDMSFTSALTYDFEVWSAAQKKWLEVSSVSNFESYQANRLKLRFKNDNKTTLCHTLNGSALALPRVLAAILENNQTDSGINIPRELIKYTGFSKIE